MTDIVIQFNDILTNFLIQMSPFIGSTYATQVESILKYNSLLPIEQFIIYAIPLRDKILNKDETYFTDNNNCKTVTDDALIISEILKLQNIYYKLDDESKSNVWDILQALLLLSDEYVINKYSP